MKILEKFGIKGTDLNILDVIYDKVITNTISMVKTESFSFFFLGTKWGHPLSQLFSTVLEVQARAIRQEENIKGIQVGKEEVKYHYKQLEQ